MFGGRKKGSAEPFHFFRASPVQTARRGRVAVVVAGAELARARDTFRELCGSARAGRRARCDSAR